MPTAAETADKARKTPELCSVYNFAVMNVKDMKVHMARKSIKSLQNDTRTELTRLHRVTVTNTNLVAVVDVVPTLNVEDVYEEILSASEGVVNNLASVLPTPRVNKSQQQPVLPEPSSIFQDAFVMPNRPWRKLWK
jgi:DNA-directed RNA polymerase subunit F